jgi:hypothetical protein
LSPLVSVLLGVDMNFGDLHVASIYKKANGKISSMPTHKTFINTTLDGAT